MYLPLKANTCSALYGRRTATSWLRAELRAILAAEGHGGGPAPDEGGKAAAAPPPPPLAPKPPRARRGAGAASQEDGGSRSEEAHEHLGDPVVGGLMIRACMGSAKLREHYIACAFDRVCARAAGRARGGCEDVLRNQRAAAPVGIP